MTEFDDTKTVNLLTVNEAHMSFDAIKFLFSLTWKCLI